MIQMVFLTELEVKRKERLDNYSNQFPFRVSIGKSNWVNYKEFNPKYNLREILPNEIVIEFDNSDRDLTWNAINNTAVNLYKAGISFEVWNHEGKSPHLHIHNLPIAHLESNKRSAFKKLFIKKYCPEEYLKWVDFSLTGIHLIAIEWQEHWKGCYGTKELINKWTPNEVAI